MNSSNKGLREDFLKDGIEGFTFGILEFVDFNHTYSKEEIRQVLYEKEQFFIDNHLKADGELIESAYNINSSASGAGRVFTEETKHKMSVSGMKKTLSQQHKDNIRRNHASKKPGFVGHQKGKPMHPNAKKLLMRHGARWKKKIAQFDLEGNFIAKYNSIIEAANKHNLYAANISKCVSGVRSHKTYGGFIWKAYTHDCLGGIVVDRPPKINIYDLDMNRVAVFDNAFEIEKKFGVHHTNVSKALKSGRSSVGYYFEYEQL
jgi:group I intron endonuclease